MNILVALVRRKTKQALRRLIQRYGVRPALLTPERWGLAEVLQRRLAIQGLPAARWGNRRL